MIEEKKFNKDKFIFDIKYEYDDKKNILKKMNYDKNGNYYFVEIYSYEYDEYGLIVKIIQMTGHPKLENRMKNFIYTYDYIKK